MDLFTISKVLRDGELTRTKYAFVSIHLEMMTTEGKVWKNRANFESITDKTLNSIPKDLRIGKVSIMNLIQRNKATVLAVSYSSFSDAAIESFLGSIPSNTPKIIVQPILNPVKWLVLSKLVPKKMDCILIRGDLPGAIEIFGMENKYAGYIFLIDSLGTIRWKAAGPASEEESRQLNEQIKILSIF